MGRMILDLQDVAFLVVEDSGFMSRVLLQVLKTLGVRKAKAATDGADALKMLRVFKADIILSDWNMAPLDGIEMTRMIRLAPDSIDPFIPIIMVTGHTEEAKIAHARDAGVTEIVAKPISPKVLYARIEEVIKRPRPFVKTKTFFGPDRRRRLTVGFKGPFRRKSDQHLDGGG